MTLTLEPSFNVDNGRYNVAGVNMIYNHIDTIPLSKTMVGSIMDPFTEKNKSIKDNIDKFIEKGIEEFKKKVEKDYPNASKVIGFHTNITKLGGDDKNAIMMLVLSGVVIIPAGPPAQNGGGRFRTKTGRSKRSVKKRKTLRR
jgi:hypothetical protein